MNKKQKPVQSLPRKGPEKLKKPAAAAEVKYYGVHACLELIRMRRDDTVRAYLTPQLIPRFKEYLSWCAATRRAYHIVEDEDMKQICQSVHHEGVCILTKEAPSLSLAALLARHRDDVVTAEAPLLFLADTGNPHNVGAILRSAAHFGIRYVLGHSETLPRVAGSVARISRGGCEYVERVLLADPLAALRKLKDQHFSLIATSSHAKHSLYKIKWPARSVIVLGHETNGVPEKIASLCDVQVSIPGSGHVESLNVSVACGILLNEWHRQHQ